MMGTVSFFHHFHHQIYFQSPFFNSLKRKATGFNFIFSYIHFKNLLLDESSPNISDSAGIPYNYSSTYVTLANHLIAGCLAQIKAAYICSITAPSTIKKVIPRQLR
uniref:Uncharacterized protein n=1 Tax=Micrurus carvalhoi TaxID=3147026 RepID=A0A2H6MVS2_9SAUR